MAKASRFFSVFVTITLLLVALSALAVSAAEDTPINCWRGQNAGANCTTGTERNKPFWSGNDIYGWDVYYDNQGDAMCVQWKVGSGAWDQTNCSYVGDGNHWYCSFDAGPVSSQTVTFEFYNDNDDGAGTGTSADCKPIKGDAEAWSGQNSFNTGPLAVTLQSLSATASALPLAGAAVAALGGLGGLALWRRRR